MHHNEYAFVSNRGEGENHKMYERGNSAVHVWAKMMVNFGGEKIQQKLWKLSMRARLQKNKPWSSLLFSAM